MAGSEGLPPSSPVGSAGAPTWEAMGFGAGMGAGGETFVLDLGGGGFGAGEARVVEEFVATLGLLASPSSPPPWRQALRACRAVLASSFCADVVDEPRWPHAREGLCLAMAAPLAQLLLERTTRAAGEGSSMGRERVPAPLHGAAWAVWARLVGGQAGRGTAVQELCLVASCALYAVHHVAAAHSAGGPPASRQCHKPDDARGCTLAPELAAAARAIANLARLPWDPPAAAGPGSPPSSTASVQGAAAAGAAAPREGSAGEAASAMGGREAAALVDAGAMLLRCWEGTMWCASLACDGAAAAEADGAAAVAAAVGLVRAVVEAPAVSVAQGRCLSPVAAVGVAGWGSHRAQVRPWAVGLAEMAGPAVVSGARAALVGSRALTEAVEASKARQAAAAAAGATAVGAGAGAGAALAAAGTPRLAQRGEGGAAGDLAGLVATGTAVGLRQGARAGAARVQGRGRAGAGRRRGARGRSVSTGGHRELARAAAGGAVASLDRSGAAPPDGSHVSGARTDVARLSGQAQLLGLAAAVAAADSDAREYRCCGAEVVAVAAASVLDQLATARLRWRQAGGAASTSALSTSVAAGVAALKHAALSLGLGRRRGPSPACADVLLPCAARAAAALRAMVKGGAVSILEAATIPVVAQALAFALRSVLGERPWPAQVGALANAASAAGATAAAVLLLPPSA